MSDSEGRLGERGPGGWGQVEERDIVYFHDPPLN